MTSSLRDRVGRVRMGTATTPRQYLLLALAAAVLVALVFFAVGQLVNDSMADECGRAATASGAPPAC